jgi:hypothetical protein
MQAMHEQGNRGAWEISRASDTTAPVNRDDRPAQAHALHASNGRMCSVSEEGLQQMHYHLTRAIEKSTNRHVKQALQVLTKILEPS